MYKSRGTTILLCLLLGGIGGHKFYLEKPGLGILYFLFCWTFIPAIFAFFELIGFLFTSDQKFQQMYSSAIPVGNPVQNDARVVTQNSSMDAIGIIGAIILTGVLASVILPDNEDGDPQISFKTLQSHATDSFLCKASTAEHMGRKVLTMNSQKTGDKYHITYPRPDNGLTTGVYCWREGKRLLWQTDGMDYTYKGTSNFTGKPGRVRNTEYDEVITFTTKPKRLTINIKFSDGSKTTQVYKIPKNEQVSIN